MKNISREQFIDKKKSDTIVIYGCGYSINSLTVEDKKKLGQLDSIGFNWFVKSKIPTTFYVLREQGTKGNFSTIGETKLDLYRSLNMFYKNTCVIALDLSESAPKWKRINTHAKPQSNNILYHNGVVLKERYAGNEFEEFKDGWGGRDKRCEIVSRKMMEYDIFSRNIIYDFCTMTTVLHIVTFLGYSRIIFVGVDLYDHRYFWLPKNVLRQTTRIAGRKLEGNHFVADYTCEFVNQYQKVTNKSLFVVGGKSLLSKYIKVIDISQI